MSVEDLREYCLSKPGSEEDFPFDETTLVFKVCGKMFALTSLKAERRSCNLKCDPEAAIELREKYPDISPGYHMSKKHWNTLALESDDYSDLELMRWIDDSYDLVCKGLSKKQRESLSRA